MRQDEELMLLYRQNAESLGREFPELGSDLDYGWASTDMGNVSCEIPSIHPCIGIGSWPAVNHQPEFAACCISPRADKAVEDGALIMARTAIDIALNRVLRERLLLSRPERSVPARVKN
jgi:metal-dependent amidase/aminoacylase/carboxypeptidase family protein